MQFPTNPRLLALLPFTAFLFNHIDEIRPQVVVFLFAKDHTDHVAQIAGTLAGRYQMRFIRASNTSHPKLAVIKDDSLLLSFVGLCHHNNLWVLFESVVRTFLIIIGNKNNTVEDTFGLVPHDNPDLCIGWCNQIRSVKYGMNGAELLQSSLWSIFTNRLTTLNAHQPLCCFDDFRTDRMGYQSYKEGTPGTIFTGFRIAIYKILAGILQAEYMSYVYVEQFKKQQPVRVSIRFGDWRFAAKFYRAPFEMIYVLSLNPHSQHFPYQFYSGALQTRYRVVVPRIVLDSASNRWKQYWTKALVILGLMLSTGFFVVIRFVCRLSESGPSVGRAWWSNALVDTWARTLSVGAGQWLGRSRAERQMLTVIAVFAFLSGSIFSGVLYEQLLVEDEVQFRYNSLDDICLAGMELNVPNELIPGFSFHNDTETGTVFLPSSNCTLSLVAYVKVQAQVNETVSALVCPENALRVLDYSPQQTMVLDQPYLILPGNIGVDKRFMETFVAKWLTRLVEHGMLDAFTRMADHYDRMLDMKRLRRGEIIADDAQLVDPMFEYFVLGFGLALGGLAFVGELVVGGRLKLVAVSWRKSNNVQSQAN